MSSVRKMKNRVPCPVINLSIRTVNTVFLYSFGKSSGKKNWKFSEKFLSALFDNFDSKFQMSESTKTYKNFSKHFDAFLLVKYSKINILLVLSPKR